MFLGDLRKRILDLWVLIRKLEFVNVGVHLVCPEVSIGRIGGHHDHLVLLDELVSELDWEAEVEIEDAGLADVFDLGTRLANLSLLVAC